MLILCDKWWTIIYQSSLTNMACETCEPVGDNMGQVHHLPPFCSCIEADKPCLRLVVLVWYSDCEQGNRKAFKMVIGQRQSNTLPKHIVTCVLPDAVQFGKNMKAGLLHFAEAILYNNMHHSNNGQAPIWMHHFDMWCIMSYHGYVMLMTSNTKGYNMLQGNNCQAL